MCLKIYEKIVLIAYRDHHNMKTKKSLLMLLGRAALISTGPERKRAQPGGGSSKDGGLTFTYELLVLIFMI
jgi:hypothetical protein